MVGLAGKIFSAAGGLDGIEIANQVCHCDVGSCQLLHVALVARQVRDGGSVSPFRNQVAAPFAQRHVGIIANLATCYIGHSVVQQRGQGTQNATLGLAPQSQQNEVLFGQDGIHNLRNHGVFVPHDSGKNRIARLQASYQIAAHLVLDGPPLENRFGIQIVGAQFPQSLGKRVSCRHRWLLWAVFLREPAVSTVDARQRQSGAGELATPSRLNSRWRDPGKDAVPGDLLRTD